MSETIGSTSMIVVCPSGDFKQKEISAHSAHPFFDSVFVFDPEGRASHSPDFLLIPAEAVGRSVLNRLSFFTNSESLPILIAPLLLRTLWNRRDIEHIVFGYPGIGPDRILAARELLYQGCEAVLLRSDDQAPVVLALARNTGNERMAAYWANCVERFSLDPGQEAQMESLWGSDMVDYLCDRVGSLRLVKTSRSSDSLSAAQNLSQIVRRAIEKLLPESQELRDDPFGNAVSVLNLPAEQIQQDPGNLITQLMLVIWSARSDLQAAFDLSTYEDRRGFVDWFLSRAVPEFDIGVEFIEPVQSERKTPQIIRAANSSSRVKTSYHETSSIGVNLIGYPRAEMGMGEQLRSCASAFETTGTPFCITDFTHGIIASQRDARYEHLIRTDNPFEVNLFHINADQMSLAVEKLGPGFFRNRYNIGYWEWELSNFPDEWLTAIDLIDEIWAPSKFIRGAISKKTSKPVIWMPLAVEFPIPPNARQHSPMRAKLNLPDRQFLFLFPFDFSSFSTRKNYWACIEAFRRAFPERTEHVGLVIKTISHARHKRAFWDLLRSIGDDRRIHIIDRVLSRTEMHELIATCDSLVSLHRSEGFGLGIAEAMYLGKPVVVTNYSGNVDFTREDNSCLVDYRLIPVNDGEYVYPGGQVWADADVEQAAGYMRRLVADRECGSALGKVAADFIRQQHSSGAVGNRYKSRLKQIVSARKLLASSVSQADSLEENTNSQAHSFFQTVKKFF